MAVFVGGVGVKIRYQCRKADGNPEDISSASVKDFYILKPAVTPLGQAVVGPIAAAFETDGIDGWLIWTTTARADLDRAASYTLQPHVIIPGYNGTFAPATFTVSQNIFPLPALP